MSRVDAFPPIHSPDSVTTSFLGEPVTGNVYTNSREVCVTYRDARAGVTLAMARPVDTPPESILNELLDTHIVNRWIL